jgi:exopolyphosphatase / guanosine-5'-triphosphate,3'-diphosphate pyrophosphatase
VRVAVVDIGTNSTRLLIADVDGSDVVERDRRSVVTRLGEGVDATGALGHEPQERVFGVLESYAEAIDADDCEASMAVMTSAVRDASNGARFVEMVCDRYGLDGRALSGDEEARFTFLGATASPAAEPERPLVVIDIGGGSTELVVGRGREVDFHVSTQIGVVRHTERFLHGDPPSADELEALAADVLPAFEAAVPEDARARAASAIAVAGTPTQCAAIDLELDPYDADRVEGHALTLETLAGLLDRLASVPLEERREVRGLDPTRAPTIVAGVVVLTQALRAFGLDEARVSERDILWGVAMETASRGRAV